MKKKIIIGIFILISIVSILLLFFHLKEKNEPKIWGSTEVKSNGLLKCDGGNVCFVKDGKIEPKNIDQITLEKLNNHCKDPRNCPPPSTEQTEKSVDTIRAFEKNSSLLVAPITTNPALGYVVFCTKERNRQCWAVDNENTEVVGKFEKAN